MKKTNQNNKHKNKPHTVNTFPSWRTLIADTGLVQSRKNELNFLHSGHMGDIINALPVIKQLSKTHKCNLFIQSKISNSIRPYFIYKILTFKILN